MSIRIDEMVVNSEAPPPQRGAQGSTTTDAPPRTVAVQPLQTSLRRLRSRELRLLAT